MLMCSPAHAAENDDTVQALIDRAFKEDVKTNAGRKKASAKLNFSKNLCTGDKCSKPLLAKLQIGHGTIAVYANKTDRAKEHFGKALELDKNATLIKGRDGPKVKAAFEAVKNPTAEAPKPTTPEPTAAAVKPKKDTRKTLDECEAGDGKFPSGWPNYKSFCYFSEAVSAEAAQEWVNCADYASRSADDNERSTTRYLGAQCAERGGRWVDALDGYLTVVRLARAENKRKTASEAGARAKFLRERIPKFVIQLPPGASDVQIEIDGEPVSAEQAGGEIWVNPGRHLVKVTGALPQGRLNWTKTVGAPEGETTIVQVAKGEIDPLIQQCIEKATSQEEVEACLADKTPSNFTFTVTAEVSGYLDSDAVEVLSPEIALQAENPVDGWGAGVSFLVDVVTAASADIVATASPRWTEVRYVPSGNAHVKVSDVDLSVNGTVSVEPDYLAIGAGAGVAIDFNQKNVVPSLRYDFGYDISGRAGTPFDAFSETIHRHAATGAITLVLDKSSILIPSVTAVLEFGDTSKPYRYVPMFAEGTDVVIGETAESVNLRRQPARLADQVPDSRQRYAAAMLYARRWEDVTLRLSERGYIDSWGVFATTTDFVLPIDVTKIFRLWPHLRFHFQTGAQFWQRAYFSGVRADGGLVIPLLRSGDRELGPMLTGTAGMATRFDLTGDDRMGLIVKADFMYTRFLDHLFTQGRFGGFGAVTYDVVFE